MHSAEVLKGLGDTGGDRRVISEAEVLSRDENMLGLVEPLP